MPEPTVSLDGLEEAVRGTWCLHGGATDFGGICFSSKSNAYHAECAAAAVREWLTDPANLAALLSRADREAVLAAVGLERVATWRDWWVTPGPVYAFREDAR